MRDVAAALDIEIALDIEVVPVEPSSAELALGGSS